MSLPARLAIVLLAALAIAGATLWLSRVSQNARQARAEARLQQDSAEAAMASGRDAVASLGAQASAESAIDRITQENADVILNAEGADAPVADPARNAALLSLCRRDAYRGSATCVQFTPAP
ncbi:hypothetical protein [Altericroceibacterium endophyticum]|uniref:Uncharacterized protein n=1 Tax=Altericroceibacterium endophyticum TaxID=1808508 RepID=A0A6I4T907_9SPHN|nr:hypothetical protein [Altericroceibacterium endophyticum]MXO66245.1 hypothetical protein [Altericroceibacterium endophyticum]